MDAWFKDQGISTSYGELYEEIDITLKNIAVGFDSLPYITTYYGSFGSFNDVEQSLYFDIKLTEANDTVWSFTPDTVFYKDIYEGTIPETQKNLTGKLYWVRDTALIKENYEFTDSADVALDSFKISLPKEFADLSGTKENALNLIAHLKINSNEVLRIININLKGLTRFAQKSSISPACGTKCLHSGTRESLTVSIDIGESKILDKTIVFAKLVLPKQGEDAGNEFEYPVPVYVYSDGLIENYKLDTAFVREHGHPSLLFWNESPTLDLQVTNALRNGDFDLTFKFANPMLLPKSFYYYNSAYSYDKVYSDRPSYSSYDFSYLEGTPAKLKIWYAETDFN